MRLIVIGLLFLAVANRLHAQSGDGYIILSSGDTLRGTISYEAGAQNPEFIQFSNGGNKQRYNINQVKEFRSADVVYTRFYVSYQQAAIDLQDAKETYDGPLVTKDVWLKLLFKSTYSLYELSTPKRKHFFVYSSSDGLKELVYRARLGSGGSLEKDEQYKNLISTYAIAQGTDQAVQEKLPASLYETDDMLDLFEALNSGQSSFRQEKTSKVLFDISGGGAFFTYNTSGTLLNDGTGAYALYRATFKSSAGFVIGAGFTFTNKINKKGIQGRIGVNLGSVSLDGENNSGEAQYQKEKYKGNLLTLEPTVSIDYALRANQVTNFSIGLMTGYNIVVSESLKSTFENPGMVVVREDFPATKGGYINIGGNATVSGNWGRLNLAVLKFSNMFDNPKGQLGGIRFSLIYGYYLKK